MLEKGIRHCDYCKRPLESGKRTQMKIERIDDRIFQDTLASLDALGITFERQADGSVTVDACTDCNKLFAAQDEQWKADKPKNLAPLRGLTFRHQSYVQKADPEDCCGCGAAFPQDYEGYVTTVGPERWVCRDCFEEFRKALGFTLET